MKYSKGNWMINPFQKHQVIIEDKDIEINVVHFDKDKEQAEANAKLIAAAPEMLDKLDLILQTCNSGLKQEKEILKSIKRICILQIKKATE